MERRIFDDMAKVEDRHWWFVGRRRIVADRIRALRLPPGAKILEAGCGSGGNLAMLASFGNLYAFERDREALEHARQRGIGRVESGRLPDAIPFDDETFDLIVLLDVLEHLEDDRAGLGALIKRLAPGGRLLMTVPGVEALWSRHDVTHHHFRRYSRQQIKAVLQTAGATVEQLTYFNTLLFPFVAAGRLWERVTRASKPLGLEIPREPLNDLLREAFASERFALSHMSLPIGASILAVARA